MRGKTLAASGLRSKTGCNVVAIEHDGQLVGNPGADAVLGADTSLVLIGDDAARDRLANLDDGWRAILQNRLASLPD
jgi:K+/H+ antiporter YhaU regulatory subunit KhtT